VGPGKRVARYRLVIDYAVAPPRCEPFRRSITKSRGSGESGSATPTKCEPSASSSLRPSMASRPVCHAGPSGPTAITRQGVAKSSSPTSVNDVAKMTGSVGASKTNLRVETSTRYAVPRVITHSVLGSGVENMPVTAWRLPMEPGRAKPTHESPSQGSTSKINPPPECCPAGSSSVTSADGGSSSSCRTWYEAGNGLPWLIMTSVRHEEAMHD
jgi:hypothetical protein